MPSKIEHDPLPKRCCCCFPWPTEATFNTDFSGVTVSDNRKEKLSIRESYYPVRMFKCLEPLHTPVSLRHGDSLRRYFGIKRKACIINNTEYSIYIVAYPYRITEFSSCLGGVSKLSLGVGTRGVSAYRKSAMIIPKLSHQNIHPPGFYFYLSIFVCIPTPTPTDGENDKKHWKPYLLNYSCDSSHDFYVQENIIEALKSVSVNGYTWGELGSYVAAHDDRIPEKWLCRGPKVKDGRISPATLGSTTMDDNEFVEHKTDQFMEDAGD